MLEPNANLTEVLETSIKHHKPINKSKIELLQEADQLAMQIDELSQSGDAELPMATKIGLSLSLADLTCDVKHVLGALVYLLQSIERQFDNLVFGKESVEEKDP